MFSRAGKYPAVGLFSVTHIISIFICFILIGLAAYVARKMKKETYFKLLKIFAIVLTCLEVFKIIWNWCLGYKSVDNWLPLYFCSIFIYSLWFAVSKNDKIRSLGLGFIAMGAGVAGAVFIISPSTSFSTYPIFHFQCMYSMLYHSTMVYSSIMLFVTKAYKINLKAVGDYCLFCLIFMTLALIVNLHTGGNMMFFNTPSGIPLPVLFKVYNLSSGLFTFVMILAHLSLGFMVWGVCALVEKIRNQILTKRKKVL